MWGEAFESAVNSGKGFWKAVSGGPQQFGQSFMNLFKGKPGFVKDFTELAEGLGVLSARTAGGQRVIIELGEAGALLYYYIDYLNSGIFSPIRHFLEQKPQPQPAGK
ncbi:hypothetical protein [Haematomicrobium sanguinis]|uniref:hypothetical protein n=1 Tax=Haematomicrobium sanguinis TaxID=479106 RepID=UPI00047B5777|nr:hypothetical protein [Haematomicrobium sanguinis]